MLRIGFLSALFFFLSLFNYVFQSSPVEFQPLSETIRLTSELILKESEEVFWSTITDVAIHKNGDILVLPSRINQVLIFDKNGNFKQTYGRKGRGPGEFERPVAIESDKNGFVYIIDRGNAKITIFSSDYRYVTDINFRGGWNTHFKTDQTSVYIWTSPNSVLPNGDRAFFIFEVKSDPWRTETYRKFEYEDWQTGHPFLNTWSHWDILENGNIIATGKLESDRFYLMDHNGSLIRSFGIMNTAVERTEEEIENKVIAASRISPEAASILEGGLPATKPIFINIEFDEKGFLWAQKNKKFGEEEKIDVYTKSGKYKTTVTLPASEDEYRMLGIYDNKVVFRAEDADGMQRIEIFRIEYE